MRRAGPLLGSLLATALVSAIAPAGASTPDTLFPDQGVAGLDVLSYRVVLTDDPATDHIDAVTHLVARTRSSMARIPLDLEGLHVTSVDVDGSPAAYVRHGTKLLITPRSPVQGRFSLRVAYDGEPRSHRDADGTTEGWVRTADGSAVVGEPVGAMDWLPCDDTPGDKASFTFDVTVPVGYEVAANGSLARRTTSGSSVRFLWRAREPMSAYLATIDIGRFDVTRSTTTSVDGRTIAIRSYVDPRADQPLATSAVAEIPEVLAFEERRFGPYPFSTAGLIDDASRVGYSLETQTRPYFDGQPDIDTEVHEFAHQWFGDSVTLTDWHDIWLAEGFATYAEWLWDGAHGGTTPATHFDQLYATAASGSLWHPAPTRFTDPADLFGSPSYDRGAMTLQALRVRVGDPDFFRILRTWARVHRHGNARTSDFVALSASVSGLDLDHFFHVWLERDGKPPAP